VKKDKGVVYKCSSCGHEEVKWLGRCPECGEWNTLVETVLKNENLNRRSVAGKDGGVGQTMPLSAVDVLSVVSGIRLLKLC